MIKEGDKLPNRIKNSLTKCKFIDEHWNENKLNSLINDCLNIEHNIQLIKKINDSVKRNKSTNASIKFYPKEEGISLLLENINNF